ncbi:hypothetical protein EDB89DRAFT_2073374 [Lactarius sanguifluus]|nr:hypothetical protein EDB89DRAFT_2073374 [Lactarius sanguifluus]
MRISRVHNWLIVTWDLDSDAAQSDDADGLPVLQVHPADLQGLQASCLGALSIVVEFGVLYSVTRSFLLKFSSVNSGDFFVLSFLCSHRAEGIGLLSDGGKWVCDMDAKQDNCVIYSFDINDKSSFEAALLERALGCEVRRYGFSVDSFGPEIQKIPNLKECAHFFPWALGSRNARRNTIPLMINVDGAEFDMLTTFLATHKLLSPFSRTTLPIGQLQIELHA